jgi:hypothetical protein
MANRDPASWAQWTEANRGRSQEEWIRDGFLDHGVTVHLPPSADDTLPLLRLLGRESWNYLWSSERPDTTAPDAVPSYAQYNAYRWLRDSGFEPGAFAYANSAIATQTDVTAGLLRYSQWQSVYPGRDGLGVLTLAAASRRGPELDLRPAISRSWVAVAVDSLIAACLISGVALVWRFTKSKADANPIDHQGE